MIATGSIVTFDRYVASALGQNQLHIHCLARLQNRVEQILQPVLKAYPVMRRPTGDRPDRPKETADSRRDSPDAKVRCNENASEDLDVESQRNWVVERLGSRPPSWMIGFQTAETPCRRRKRLISRFIE